MASLPGTLESLGTGIYRGLKGDASWNPWDDNASVADISALGTRYSQDPRMRQYGRAVGTAIGTYFTGGALAGYLGSAAAGGAASGALWGGAQAAGTDQDPWKGAARGAAWGGATGALADYYSGGAGGSTTSGGSGDMYSLTYGMQEGNSGLYGISGGTGASASDPFWSSAGAAGSGGSGLYDTGSLSASGNSLALLSDDTGYGVSGLRAADTFGLAGGTGLQAPPRFSTPQPALGGGMDMGLLSQGGEYLRRMWRNPYGRMMLMRAGTGLYARNRMRKLERRLGETDVTQMPGYRAGERALVRRAAAGGYADSSRMLAELSDYGQREYDRFAANERANYQARMGGLQSELETLGMLSLAMGF